jgi:diguanylate cyclase (GGDEF)-like protein
VACHPSGTHQGRKSHLIDSIPATLTHAQTRRADIDTLNDSAWQLRQTQTDRAYELSQRALALSTSDVFASQPYRLGQATSLTTQGYLNRQSGKLDEALSQCLQAEGLLDDLLPSRVSVDCQRTISWIYYFLGDTANALNYALRALELSRELKLRVQEASVLDALALIYVASGDPQQGLLSSESAAQIARTAGDPLLESTVLNNRANVLLKMALPEAALEAALESLALARRESLTGQEFTILDTVGEILIAQGDLPRAGEYLREGLELADRSGIHLGRIYYLLGLGKLGLRQLDLEQAEIHLNEALQRSTSSGAQALQAESHAQLAELYERKGEVRQALEHYKLFHSIHDQVNGELSSKRLAAVNVAHQVETARRDGEIYRLRNVELQREIEERRRVEVELERLAATDPLTNLYNRRRFYELAQREFSRAVRYDRPLAVLMLDLDHFKAVNDVHGHAVGDQVLALFSALVQKVLREVDVIGRYGGEEFCVVLTESNAKQGRRAAERVQHAVEQHRFETAAGEVALTVSIGLASLPSAGTAPPGNLDQLLDRADQALYRAKRAGRNRVEAAPQDA